MNLIDRCAGRIKHDRIYNVDKAIIDGLFMLVENIEESIVEIRAKDKSVEWRAACDEILDMIKSKVRPGAVDV